MFKRNFFSRLFHRPHVSIFILFFALFSSDQFSHAKCISDYHLQQKKIPHSISAKELRTLDTLARNGAPLAGWKIIGRQGDPYAFLAAKVLSNGENFQDQLYRKLISNHWINTVGVKTFRSLFLATAQEHFKQYVELLHSGYWPDSDQIVLSYLTAVRKNHLPDITVFDAAWDAAGFNYFRSWQSLNHFPASRIILPTQVCFNVNKFEAQQVLTKDFMDLPFEFIFQL